MKLNIRVPQEHMPAVNKAIDFVCGEWGESVENGPCYNPNQSFKLQEQPDGSAILHIEGERNAIAQDGIAVIALAAIHGENFDITDSNLLRTASSVPLTKFCDVSPKALEVIYDLARADSLDDDDVYYHSDETRYDGEIKEIKEKAIEFLGDSPIAREAVDKLSAQIRDAVIYINHRMQPLWGTETLCEKLQRNCIDHPRNTGQRASEDDWNLLAVLQDLSMIYPNQDIQVENTATPAAPPFSPVTSSRPRSCFAVVMPRSFSPLYMPFCFMPLIEISSLTRPKSIKIEPELPRATISRYFISLKS